MGSVLNEISESMLEFNRDNSQTVQNEFGRIDVISQPNGSDTNVYDRDQVSHRDVSDNFTLIFVFIFVFVLHAIIFIFIYHFRSNRALQTAARMKTIAMIPIELDLLSMKQANRWLNLMMVMLEMLKMNRAIWMKWTQMKVMTAKSHLKM